MSSPGGTCARWVPRPARFTRWAAVSASDAAATFEAIRDELVEVRWAGQTGLLLAENAEPLSRAEPVTAVRFVAFGGDPVLQPGEQIVAGERAHRRSALPAWACTGLVLRDGRVVASWGRSQGRVTIVALADSDQQQRREIEAEALRMPLHGGTPNVCWRGLDRDPHE